MRPREAFIAVTYACNARCSMCNIWKNPPEDLLKPDHYSKIPNSLDTVNITGGEPFLRKDLVEVLRCIHVAVPKARFVFSTNGMLTETIVRVLDEVRKFHPQLGIGVSIDGLEEVHDRIRGVPGLFHRAISTVKELKARGYSDLRIAMTISEDNATEVKKVHDLSKELGVELSMVVAHDSEVYFKNDKNRKPVAPSASMNDLSYVLRSQLKSKHVKDWYRAFHTRGMMDSDHRLRFASACEAGKRYFFMAPNGDVYPCNVMNHRIGNLGEVPDWDSLFAGGSEEQVRRLVEECKKGCWMVCNTRSLVMAHPVKVTYWVVSNKFRPKSSSATQA